jgi:uncharacterized cupin superfamily protein
MEAIIPPGGGPPLHIHQRDEESFYLLEGTLDITLGEKKLKATTGDFVPNPSRNGPRISQRREHDSQDAARFLARRDG